MYIHQGKCLIPHASTSNFTYRGTQQCPEGEQFMQKGEHFCYRVSTQTFSHSPKSRSATDGWTLYKNPTSHTKSRSPQEYIYINDLIIMILITESGRWICLPMDMRGQLIYRKIEKNVWTGSIIVWFGAFSSVFSWGGSSLPQFPFGISFVLRCCLVTLDQNHAVWKAIFPSKFRWNIFLTKLSSTLSFILVSFIKALDGNFALPLMIIASHWACSSDIDNIPPVAGCTKPINASSGPISGLNTYLYSWKINHKYHRAKKKKNASFLLATI